MEICKTKLHTTVEKSNDVQVNLVKHKRHLQESSIYFNI